MDIKARRQALVLEIARGDQMIARLEAALKEHREKRLQVVGAVLLCDEILKENAAPKPAPEPAPAPVNPPVLELVPPADPA